MTYPYFVKASGIYYPREIETIKKSKEIYQPFWEAITNAWEAILDKFGVKHLNDGTIDIQIYVNKTLVSEENLKYDFVQAVVSDNGIGLNEDNLERLINLRDSRKNHSNKGTGRIQYLHYFSSTKMESTYQNVDGHFDRISATLSKKEPFIIDNNSILRIDTKDESILAANTGTIVTFESPLTEKEGDAYSTTNPNVFKSLLIRHFLVRLCEHRTCFPQIKIEYYIDGQKDDEITITAQDIPTPDKEDDIFSLYSKIENNKIIASDQGESFHIRAFVESDEHFEKNMMRLSSKGELGVSIPLSDLAEDESLDGKRYLFILSGDYLDSIDSDDRGNLQLLSEKEFKKRNEDPQLFSEEVILKETLINDANEKVASLYTEIGAKEEAKMANLSELQQMFLLDQDTVDAIKRKVKKSSTDAEILALVYSKEMDKIAEQDARMREKSSEISLLNPADANYQANLYKRMEELVQFLPEQNKVSLTKYVARRKIVLELFDKILQKEIDKVADGGRMDENILHNLIFKQHSTNPSDSDLWIINDECIYFNGCSEVACENMTLNNENIFRSEFTEEEQKYLKSLGEDRLKKRPDILLFPEEGKCIIIEFKALDVNVAYHLDQIAFYASLLLNYTIDKYHFTRFYGYLIGESIEDRDVRGRVSSFEYSPKFGFWYKPSEKVTNFNEGGLDGSIYTEIIKYSSLLERAKARNRIFIEKLEGK